MAIQRPADARPVAYRFKGFNGETEVRKTEMMGPKSKAFSLQG